MNGFGKAKQRLVDWKNLEIEIDIQLLVSRRGGEGAACACNLNKKNINYTIKSGGLGRYVIGGKIAFRLKRRE